MRVEALIPDVAPSPSERMPKPEAFSAMLDDLGAMFGKAQQSEDAFASGTGDLQSAVYERAKADVALSVATAAAQKAVQALQAVLNMQV